MSAHSGALSCDAAVRSLSIRRSRPVQSECTVRQACRMRTTRPSTIPTTETWFPNPTRRADCSTSAAAPPSPSPFEWRELSYAHSHRRVDDLPEPQLQHQEGPQGVAVIDVAASCMFPKELFDELATEVTPLVRSW